MQGFVLIKNRLASTTLVVVLALMVGADAAAKKVYKWTDAAGNTHYGDNIPAHIKSGEQIAIPKSSGVGADVNNRHERTTRLLDSLRKERIEKREAKAKSKLASKERAAQCEMAQERQYRYEHSAFLYDVNQSGERIVLGDDEHAQALASARTAVAKWCK